MWQDLSLVTEQVKSLNNYIGAGCWIHWPFACPVPPAGLAKIILSFLDSWICQSYQGDTISHPEQYLLSKHQRPKANSFLAPLDSENFQYLLPNPKPPGEDICDFRGFGSMLWGQKLIRYFSRSIFTQLKCSLEASPVFLPLEFCAQPCSGLM